MVLLTSMITGHETDLQFVVGDVVIHHEDDPFFGDVVTSHDLIGVTGIGL